jgi:putative phosphonate metabolism protein
MARFPRYAIYHAPAQGAALDQFGAEMLGYDAWSGAAMPFPEGVVETVSDWRALTEDPRKYGFHATLKAPMSLASGKSESELLAACADFAAQPRSIPVFTPVVNAISGFVAVIPAAQSNALEQFAADCVRAFDPFRALLTPDDRARRNPSKLTPRQIEYLDLWGYPYVMEEFRFHLTLTGRLDEARREGVIVMLRERFARLGLNELAVDRIALFKQNDAKARFTIIGDWPLRAHIEL